MKTISDNLGVNPASTIFGEVDENFADKQINQKYPVSFCGTQALWDDLLNGIIDLKVYGVPCAAIISINRCYVNEGVFRIELFYTDMDNIYAFWWQDEVDDIDFETDQLTEIEFSYLTGAKHRATMVVNWSKISDSLSYTNTTSNHSNIRFHDSVKTNVYADNPDVILPAVIPAVVGHKFRICLESACHNGDKYKLRGNGYEMYSNLVEARSYYYGNISVAGDTDFDLMLKDNGNVLKWASSVITAVASSSGNGVTKKIVVCGDSKTDKTTKLEWLTSLFDSDVMGITLLGTQDSGTYPNEGYSGSNVIELTQDATLNGIANPFYNAALGPTYYFDIATFISTVGDTPDIVWIDHGANQTNEDWVDVKAAYDAIISNVATYNSTNGTSIRVVISVQESAAIIPDINGNVSLGKNVLLSHARNMIDEYDGRTGEGIFICPQFLHVDLEWDFPWAYCPMQNNIGSLERRTSDKTHPGEQSFDTYDSGTTYNEGSQVSNGGDDWVCLLDGTEGVTPVDDKINWTIIEDGIGAGYRNIAEAYFTLIKYMETV